MSFNFVTAGWIAVIFILYTFMVVLLPYFVLRSFLRGRRLTQKFIFCVVFGNFFYIMIVLLWGLLHITNRYVLIATTLVLPAAKIFVSRRAIWEGCIEPVWINLGRFLRRENSFHYSLRKVLRWVGCRIKSMLLPGLRLIRDNAVEAILFAGCSAFILWYFSVTDHFGPQYSDLVVHMYWINGVDDGILFRGGIYPFGMHALIYYIHAVFGIPTVRLVLLFGPVQTFYIFTMLLVFLKELCRFRYTPYLTYVAFSAGNYLLDGRYGRYYATLPQEFGMMFLLPCAVALIRFFRAVRDENLEYRRMKEQKLLYTQITGRHRWKESTIQLWVLIISFGLTLSAHFYITIVAAVLLIAAAVAYVRYLFSLKTLRRLVLAAVISVAIPIFPMGVAFAGGTPLQGSLYWAMSVMGIERPGSNTAEEEEEPDTVLSEEVPEETPETDAVPETSGEIAEDLTADAQEPEEPVLTPSMEDRLRRFAEDAWTAAYEFIYYLCLNTNQDFQVWKICMAVMLALIPLMWIFREWEYSRYLILVLVYTGLLVLMGISGKLGLPTLIDEDRSSLFFSYTVLVCLSLAADGVLLICGRIIRVRVIWQIASMALAVGFVFYTVGENRIRGKSSLTSSLQRDGAALCVFDIMENYPAEKWTIVSCNEERNMISAEGWHYEVIDFLSSMENYEEGDEMYIPTQYVFFFVEKKSLDYAVGEFTDADAYVSEEWASQELAANGGLTPYQNTDRIVTNSRMYYWAQEYQRRFPNELKVFYEDDDFVCYFIEQNEYYLNNFAIDYGYNSGR